MLSIHIDTSTKYKYNIRPAHASHVLLLLFSAFNLQNTVNISQFSLAIACENYPQLCTWSQSIDKSNMYIIFSQRILPSTIHFSCLYICIAYFDDQKFYDMPNFMNVSCVFIINKAKIYSCIVYLHYCGLAFSDLSWKSGTSLRLNAVQVIFFSELTDTECFLILFTWAWLMTAHAHESCVEAEKLIYNLIILLAPVNF